MRARSDIVDKQMAKMGFRWLNEIGGKGVGNGRVGGCSKEVNEQSSRSTPFIPLPWSALAINNLHPLPQLFELSSLWLCQLRLSTVDGMEQGKKLAVSSTPPVLGLVHRTGADMSKRPLPKLSVPCSGPKKKLIRERPTEVAELEHATSVAITFWVFALKGRT